MGTIAVFENVSLDAVTQDPTGDEGLNSADWRSVLTAADRDAWNRLILEDALRAQALLLGRRSYEFFAARYPRRSGPLAERMNGMPKYVVSGSLTDPAWNNSTLLKGEALEEISALRRAFDGEIRVYASSALLPMLIEHELVDELRLVVFPVLMGVGARIFDRTGEPAPLSPKPLRLVDIHRVGDALAVHTYAPMREGGAD
ncbi:dihydrofolate reductase [Nocardia sp. GAS34]|uniref:dihydrofolate reductase family protein n=1 Tax=unclassified Nocardia TaxID=2637762 RepID=UPI003D1C7240